jgi:tetratricopeptide (TPR) repeat protein
LLGIGGLVGGYVGARLQHRLPEAAIRRGLAVSNQEEAITSYQQSLAIKRETGDQHGEGETLENLGDAYQKLRQPDRAAACWREAAAAAMRSADDHWAATRLEQLAENTRPRRRWGVLHRRSSS